MGQGCPLADSATLWLPSRHELIVQLRERLSNAVAHGAGEGGSASSDQGQEASAARLQAQRQLLCAPDAGAAQLQRLCGLGLR